MDGDTTKNLGSAEINLLEKWEIFYLEHFKKPYSFKGITIPKCPGNGWALLIITNISLKKLYSKCNKLFGCDKNFNSKIDRNERDPKKGPYAIWVRYNARADKDLKNTSANSIKEEGITTLTLGEYLLFAMYYFIETGGKHLDSETSTLCAGSRFCDGSVPIVHWCGYGEKMIVCSCHPFHFGNNLRVREVVSQTF